jgi:phage terminase small subunit
MAATRNQHGLTAKQERFATIYATQAVSKSEAYRRAYSTANMADKTIHETACKLAAQPKIAARIDQILAEMRVEDIVSAQKIVRMTLEGWHGAMDAGNYTAAAAFADKLLKTKGLLRDRVAITDERAASDDDLVAYLAKGDPQKAAMLKSIMGQADKFDA